MPGDTIEYHLRTIGRRKAMWWFHGDAKVNGATVAEADVGAMLPIDNGSADLDWRDASGTCRSCRDAFSLDRKY